MWLWVHPGTVEDVILDWKDGSVPLGGIFQGMIDDVTNKFRGMADSGLEEWLKATVDMDADIHMPEDTVLDLTDHHDMVVKYGYDYLPPDKYCDERHEYLMAIHDAQVEAASS